MQTVKNQFDKKIKLNGTDANNYCDRLGEQI